MSDEHKELSPIDTTTEIPYNNEQFLDEWYQTCRIMYKRRDELVEHILNLKEETETEFTGENVEKVIIVMFSIMNIIGEYYATRTEPLSFPLQGHDPVEVIKRILTVEWCRALSNSLEYFKTITERELSCMIARSEIVTHIRRSLGYSSTVPFIRDAVNRYLTQTCIEDTPYDVVDAFKEKYHSRELAMEFIRIYNNPDLY